MVILGLMKQSLSRAYVSDLAIRAGYKLGGTFSRAFNRAFNTPPTRYRQCVFDAGGLAIDVRL